MALSRAAQLTARHLMNASKHLPIQHLLRPSTVYMSRRLKTYLVGVDGSGFGFSALRSTVKSASNGDEIICMYFPPNLEVQLALKTNYNLMMVQPTTVQTLSKELYDAQHEHTVHIETKCKEIMQKYTPKDRDIRFEMHVGEHSFSPKDDLVEECYKTKADVLVIGAKGLSHSLKETISDKWSRAGHVADFCVHHAPCDVMVVKIPHEY